MQLRRKKKDHPSPSSEEGDGGSVTSSGVIEYHADLIIESSTPSHLPTSTTRIADLVASSGVVAVATDDVVLAPPVDPIQVDFDPFQLLETTAKQQDTNPLLLMSYISSDDADSEISNGEFILQSVSEDDTVDLVYHMNMESPPLPPSKKRSGNRKRGGGQQQQSHHASVITPEQHKERDRRNSSSSSSSHHRDDDHLHHRLRSRSKSSSRRTNNSRSSSSSGGFFSCGDFDDDISDTFRMITQPLKNFKRCGPNETKAVFKDFHAGTNALEEFLKDKLREFRDNNSRRRSSSGGGSGRLSSRREEEYEGGDSAKRLDLDRRAVA